MPINVIIEWQYLIWILCGTSCLRLVIYTIYSASWCYVMCVFVLFPVLIGQISTRPMEEKLCACAMPKKIQYNGWHCKSNSNRERNGFSTIYTMAFGFRSLICLQLFPLLPLSLTIDAIRFRIECFAKCIHYGLRLLLLLWKRIELPNETFKSVFNLHLAHFIYHLYRKHITNSLNSLLWLASTTTNKQQ